MAIYFTISKSPKESLTVIFSADGLKRAVGYKRGLVLDGAYQECQITISGTDSNGQLVKA
jgi:hypothetical protein